jgi:hypothetical protein
MQSRLVNRDLSVAQFLKFILIVIDADHLVAVLCEAGSGYQADVTGSDDSDGVGHGGDGRLKGERVKGLKGERVKDEG